MIHWSGCPRTLLAPKRLEDKNLRPGIESNTQPSSEPPLSSGLESIRENRELQTNDHILTADSGKKRNLKHKCSHWQLATVPLFAQSFDPAMKLQISATATNFFWFGFSNKLQDSTVECQKRNSQPSWDAKLCKDFRRSRAL